MKIYTIHIDKNNPEYLERAEFIQEGFSLWAAVFLVFWAIFHRMWLCAAALIVANICFITMENSGIINHSVSLVLQLGFIAYVGFEANNWYRRSLERKGYEFYEIIAAKNIEEAKYKFFTGQTGAN
ncbi:MAG: hypothetical protein K0R98_126 [Rickettsiaceae bacterium]|jgi:hypothetical protein|nr:hypothetical protein [Rickettsiaceae bacterium]